MVRRRRSLVALVNALLIAFNEPWQITPRSALRLCAARCSGGRLTAHRPGKRNLTRH
jgi:hypothetical protein